MAGRTTAMKQMAVAVVIACLAAMLAAGCTTMGQPRLENVSLQRVGTGEEAHVLVPGDSAVVTVEVADPHGIVKQVIGHVSGYPEVEENTFVFRDDGEAPDEVAGDGIWTELVDVRLQAPKGPLTLVLYAYNSHGERIEVKTKEGVAPLSASVSAVIEFDETFYE
jgi:hypothetical protein